MNYSLQENCLSGKNILVTGASSGIGKEIALQASKFGARVILQGKNIDRLNQIYDIIVENELLEPYILPLDLQRASLKNYQDLSDKIQDEFKTLDAVVLNAGVLGVLSSILQTNLEDFDKVMQINMRANFMLVKSILPCLNRRAHSALIFNSSSVGREARAYWGSYAISKFALEGFAQVLADELKNTTIRVNTVNPGAVDTKMRDRAYPAEDKSKIAKPHQITDIYIHLMSNSGKDIHAKQLNAQ